MMLPARFRYKDLKNMPKDEAVEMVYKYSQFFDVPVTEETVYLIAEVSEGSPFYISSIMRSGFGAKDISRREKVYPGPWNSKPWITGETSRRSGWNM
jgi:hypothetical protein